MGQLAKEEGFKISVNKERLIETLKSNREKHNREFKEAWCGYLDTVKNKMATAMHELEEHDKVPSWNFLQKLSVPKDHTADYDHALEMMSWSEGDEVVLSAALFNAFIRDEWDWSGTHRSTWQAYNKV